VYELGNHKAGITSNKYAMKYGIRLMPVIDEKLNPMPYGDAHRKKSLVKVKKIKVNIVTTPKKPKRSCHKAETGLP
jgi:hypothetical protein